MIDERARHQLYVTLEDRLGGQEADTLMELLPPVGWADVATKHDLLALEERIDLRFDAMDQRIDSLEQRVATKADLAAFATKADLERFATKADLERFATKADLAGFATKADLERFATKADLAGFATKADLAGFATKDGLAALQRSMMSLMVGLLLTVTAILLTAMSLIR